MTTQREKDKQVCLERGNPHTETWADGAEYARRELFERLRRDVSGWDLMYLNGIAKEYGL